jgi:hypothetical protein
MLRATGPNFVAFLAKASKKERQENRGAEINK